MMISVFVMVVFMFQFLCLIWTEKHGVKGLKLQQKMSKVDLNITGHPSKWWNKWYITISLHCTVLKAIYTTENFCHGSDKNGTRTQKNGLAQINFAV